MKTCLSCLGCFFNNNPSNEVVNNNLGVSAEIGFLADDNNSVDNKSAIIASSRNESVYILGGFNPSEVMPKMHFAGDYKNDSTYLSPIIINPNSINMIGDERVTIQQEIEPKSYNSANETPRSLSSQNQELPSTPQSPVPTNIILGAGFMNGNFPDARLNTPPPLSSYSNFPPKLVQCMNSENNMIIV